MSTSAEGFDSGGVLVPGCGFIARTTLYPIRMFSSEQLAAYEAAVALVERWRARDAETT